MANVWRGLVLKLFQAQKEKVYLQRTMAKQTLDAYFLPDKPSSVPESYPNSEDESESDDTSVAKKCKKYSFLHSNENATPLSVAFRRQEAVNQCAEEAELIFKFKTPFSLPRKNYTYQI